MSTKIGYWLDKKARKKYAGERINNSEIFYSNEEIDLFTLEEALDEIEFIETQLKGISKEYDEQADREIIKIKNRLAIP